MALKTECEIDKFEYEWKIETITTKFKILSASKSKQVEVNNNNQIIPFADSENAWNDINKIRM